MRKELPEQPLEIKETGTKQRVFIIGNSSDSSLSKEDQKLIDQLAKEGKIEVIKEKTREIPTIDVSQFQKDERGSNKLETPWQLKKQSKK